MNKNELLIKAKELGIENAEALTAPQLKIAVENAQNKIAVFDALKLKATGLGIVFSEDITEEDLNAEILATEEVIEAQRLVDEFNEKVHALIEATIGYDNFERLSADEISEGQKVMSEFYQKAKSFIEGVIDFGEFEALSVEELIASLKTKSEASNIEVVFNGKTDKTFKSGNGREYQFSEKAPGEFRFAGVVKTQSEWIEDEDAMEIMVSGNLSYVKPLKK
jgi:hypothetical protein